MKTGLNVFNILLIGASVGLFSGCEEPSGVSPTDLASVVSPDTGVTQKVLLSKAYYEDIKPHVGVCRGNKLCVVICHKPPGNPANEKTLILPLQAMAAHLHHGGPEHEDHDYVGPCGAPNDDDDHEEDDGDGTTDPGDGSGDDGSGDGTTDPGDGSGDDGSGDGTTDPGDGSGDGGGVVVIDPIPNWCVEFYEFDQDCDGINDNTGLPYF